MSDTYWFRYRSPQKKYSESTRGFFVLRSWNCGECISFVWKIESTWPSTPQYVVHCKNRPLSGSYSTTFRTKVSIITVLYFHCSSMSDQMSRTVIRRWSQRASKKPIHFIRIFICDEMSQDWLRSLLNAQSALSLPPCSCAVFCVLPFAPVLVALHDGISTQS